MFGPRHVLETEERKAQDTWTTLKRFAGFLRKYWFGLVLVMVFILVSSWANIVYPELIGQAVDCYLRTRMDALALGPFWCRKAASDGD